jgi:hypothetical protein
MELPRAKYSAYSPSAKATLHMLCMAPTWVALATPPPAPNMRAGSELPTPLIIDQARLAESCDMHTNVQPRVSVWRCKGTRACPHWHIPTTLTMAMTMDLSAVLAASLAHPATEAQRRAHAPQVITPVLAGAAPGMAVAVAVAASGGPLKVAYDEMKQQS